MWVDRLENSEIQSGNSKHNGSRVMPQHPEWAVTTGLEGPAGTGLLTCGFLGKVCPVIQMWSLRRAVAALA